MATAKKTTKTTKKTASNTTRKRPATRAEAPSTRQLQPVKKDWLKPSTWHTAQPAPQYPTLAKARFILRDGLKALYDYKVQFGLLGVIYTVLSLLFVRGLSGGQDLVAIRTLLDDAYKGVTGQAQSVFLQLTYLFGSVGGSSATSGLYQTIGLIVFSLAFIWGIRRAVAKQAFRTRDMLYQGMYPLVPFLLIVLIAGLQLIPISVGGFLYQTIIGSGIAVTGLEQIGVLLLTLSLFFWSLYMITPTLFAFYIVTLPDMTPLAAFRSANQLVYKRRLLIWRKLIFLPVVLLLGVSLILIPFILIFVLAAPYVLYVLFLLCLPILHSYLYMLYRELLREK